MSRAPLPTFPTVAYPLLREGGRYIQVEIQELLSKGAISLSMSHSSGLLSNLFLIEKRNGGQRLVINLREFNKCLIFHHFKVEGIHFQRDLQTQRLAGMSGSEGHLPDDPNIPTTSSVSAIPMGSLNL